MKCPYCEKEVPATAAKCPKCWANLISLNAVKNVKADKAENEKTAVPANAGKRN